jgi:hypothetical protein
MWESVLTFRPIEEDSWRNPDKEKRGPKLASSDLPHTVASHGVPDPEDEAVWSFEMWELPAH